MEIGQKNFGTKQSKMNVAPLAFVLIALWMFSPDKQLFGVASLLLIFLAKSSWRHDEPKIIFFGVAFYWMTVCTLMIYGIFFNRPMVELTQVSSTFIYTSYLALFSTFIYSYGILYAIKNIEIYNEFQLYKELEKFDGKKLLLFYSIYSFVASVFGGVVLSLGGLSQAGVALIWVKWAFLTLLIMHTLLFPSNQKWVFIILLIEVILSFSGFWSSFKDYLFMAAASFLTFSSRLSVKRVVQVVALGIVSFFLMVVWSVVKGEYRAFLTGGEKSQVIATESKTGNLQKLTELVGEKFNKEHFDENFSKGVEALAFRISYTEFFAMAVRQVPDILPYEEGNLLMAGFEHVFKPRLFFPDKKNIDDSYLTSKYTGRQFSGADQGVSFSLGLVAERYIDYGPLFMFLPIFGFGLMLGYIYKYIISHSLNRIWGLSFVSPLFFLIPNLGVATTKFLGWVLTYFIVWFIFNKYLVKRVDKYLRNVSD